MAQDTCLDSAVKILASGLPSRGLKDLRLSFEGCNRITDQSLTALGPLGCTELLQLSFRILTVQQFEGKGLLLFCTSASYLVLLVLAEVTLLPGAAQVVLGLHWLRETHRHRPISHCSRFAFKLGGSGAALCWVLRNYFLRAWSTSRQDAEKCADILWNF